MPKRLSGSVKVFYPDYDRGQLLEKLRQRLLVLEALLPLKRVVLFGSWAVGRETAFSDIDLLVVYSGPPREDAYKIVRGCFSLRGLEPHVYSQEEAEKSGHTLGCMAKKGIVLFPGGTVPIDAL